MDETKGITLGNDAFQESVRPKVVKDAQGLYLFECPATDINTQEIVCGNPHFRHAGYLEALMPFQRPDKSKVVDKTSYQVMVCTKCRACYIWLNEQMYDVTAMVDLEAWAKAERELHQATGPGGQC